MKIGFGFDVPPQQAINYFRAKGLRPTFSYAEMVKGEHANSFTIAKMLDMDLLQDVYDSLLQAMAKGESMAAWKKRIIPHLQANGWWGKQAMIDPKTGQQIMVQLGSVRRLELIFRTNMLSAYAAGQWQQIQETKNALPYLRYNAVDDLRTRDEHRAWDNKIYPVDHPFWRTHYPLNGWNCRCSVIQLSPRMMDEQGLTVSPDDNPEYRDWKNPNTGQTEQVPKGIDPGFQFNAGIQRTEHLQRIAREKAEAIKDAELRDAAENGLTVVEKKRDIMPPVTKQAENMSPVRTEWKEFPEVIVNAPLKEASNHPFYQQAKGGSPDAALQLAQDILTQDSISKLTKLAGDKNPILVSVHAEEAVSINHIPLAMSIVIADKTGWEFDTTIVQSKKVGRTSAPDGFYRIAVTPTFTGEFPNGRAAIILDDTLTQGGTFASMKGHIESQGGIVIGALALTGKQYSAKIAISAETLASLREKYGQLEKWFEVYLGYDFSRLTESEARYIIGSKQDADTIKNRLIAAREGCSS